MVITPPLFAFYCFVSFNPWKKSITKLHNVNTTQLRQGYNPQSLETLIAVLVKRAFCWYLGRSREAASGAVLEIFLVNMKSREAAPEPFGNLPEPFSNSGNFLPV